MENILLLILLLEVLSWLFVIVLSNNFTFYYLVIQAYFLFWRFISVFTGAYILLIVIIFLKIGIPPFQAWALNLLSRVNKFTFWFIRSMHKLLPIMVLITLLLLNLIILIIIIIVVISSSLVIKRGRLIITISLSSISHSGWILLGRLVSISFVIFYFFIYYVLLFCFIKIFLNRNLDAFNQRALVNSGWLFLSGIPPFIVFWLKINIILRMSTIRARLTFILLVWVILFIQAYYRLFSLNLKNEQNHLVGRYVIIPINSLRVVY